MKKVCLCDIQSAMFNDFGIIKCQYCMGEVSKERADKFIAFNKPPLNSDKKEDGR